MKAVLATALMVLCAHVIASDATSTHMLRSRIRACMYMMMEPYTSLMLPACLPAFSPVGIVCSFQMCYPVSRVL